MKPHDSKINKPLTLKILVYLTLKYYIIKNEHLT